ncbi:MAG: DUF2848 domain-containing protein [Lautropia sp.]
MNLSLTLIDAAGAHDTSLALHTLVVAGWTGRDADAIAHHIAELAAIGIPAPSAVPLFYRVAASLATQQASIQVVGAGSSGEIEPVLLRALGAWWLTLGSDHTDRDAERNGIAIAKQACAKPIARVAWRFDDVRDRLDALELVARIAEDGATETYQRGTLARIRPLPGLIDDMLRATGLPLRDGLAMFCGTLPAIGPIRASSRFGGELRDPVSGRSIALDYRIDALPLVS